MRPRARRLPAHPASGIRPSAGSPIVGAPRAPRSSSTTSSTGGATQFTVIPWLPHWRAADFASARIPSTALANGTSPAAPVSATVGVMSTRRPPRVEKASKAAWQHHNAVRSTASHRVSHPPRSVSAREAGSSALGSTRACTVCRALVDAGALDLGVAAEGVETVAQHRELLELGCRFAQGFQLARPLPPQAAARVLREGVAVSDLDT